MRKIDNYEGITAWGYQDKRLGKGFAGTRDHIIVQVQNAYVQAGIPFHEKEIPALIDDWMCEQGLAKNCSDKLDGLGDLVQLALKPFVHAVDRTLGTHISSCSGCAARQNKLNEAFPL